MNTCTHTHTYTQIIWNSLTHEMHMEYCCAFSCDFLRCRQCLRFILSCRIISVFSFPTLRNVLAKSKKQLWTVCLQLGLHFSVISNNLNPVLHHFLMPYWTYLDFIFANPTFARDKINNWNSKIQLRSVITYCSLRKWDDHHKIWNVD